VAPVGAPKDGGVAVVDDVSATPVERPKASKAVLFVAGLAGVGSAAIVPVAVAVVAVELSAVMAGDAAVGAVTSAGWE
jgi:hypothetical protein